MRDAHKTEDSIHFQRQIESPDSVKEITNTKFQSQESLWIFEYSHGKKDMVEINLLVQIIRFWKIEFLERLWTEEFFLCPKGPMRKV